VRFQDFQDEFESLITDELELVCAGDDRPSESELRELERRLGVTLPAEYRAFATEYGAAYVEVREEYWPRPRVGQTGPFWLFQYGFFVYGTASGIPDDLNIEQAHQACQEAFGTELPFAFLPVYREVCSGYRTGFGPEGGLFELAEDDASDPTPIEGGFWQFLLGKTRELSARNEEFKQMRSRKRNR
jgi:hypothetical protein